MPRSPTASDATAITEAALGPARRALLTRRALETGGAVEALERWVNGGGDAVVFGAAPVAWSFPNVVGEELGVGGVVRSGAGDAEGEDA